MAAVLIYCFRWHLFSSWAPDRIILPYLGFFVLLARGKSFASCMFFAGVCIHGRVDLPVFTLLPLAVSVIVYWKKMETRELLQGLLVGLMFLTPIALDGLLHLEHSNVVAVLHAKVPRPETLEVSETLTFLRSYWNLPWFMNLLAAIGFLLSKNKSFALWGLVLSVISGVYFLFAPRPLHFYMGLFYWSVVVFLITYYAHQLVFKCRLLGVLSIVCCLIYYPTFQTQPQLNAFIPTMSRLILENSSPDESIALGYTKPEYWPEVAGLTLKLHQLGRDVCVQTRVHRVLFTRRFVCDESERAVFEVVEPDRCDGTCLYQDQNRALSS